LLQISGWEQTAVGVYEFLAAWRGDRGSFASIAVTRMLLYVVLNRVWEWGIGWPSVDLNLVITIVAAEVAML
jgi:hypothetical protein